MSRASLAQTWPQRGYSTDGSDSRCWGERENRLAVFDRLLKKSDPTFREINVENRNGVIAFSGDGRMIFLAGDRSLELIKDSDLNRLEKYPLPSGFETASLLIQPDGTAVAAPSAAQHRPGVIFENGTAREFGSASRGILVNYPSEPANAAMSLVTCLVREDSQT